MEDMESIKKLEDLIVGSGAEKPNIKNILEMIESADFDEEEKENMRQIVMANMPQIFGGYGSGALLGVIFVAVIFSVLFFFGYKLYKSIKDKEKRKEEKKKAKQMKKKK